MDYHGLRKTAAGWEIDFELDRISQLLESDTPLPLPFQSFNPEIISYATELLSEIPAGDATSFVLWLPDEEITPGLGARIEKAYRTLLHELVRRQRREAARHLAECLAALGYGTAFMLICQILRYTISFENPMLQSSFSEGMLVLGWVALWRPFELLLFSWWPAWRRIRLIHRMSRVAIVLRRRTPGLTLWERFETPHAP